MFAAPSAQALLDEVRLRKFYKKVLRTERASLISYLPLREASGTVAIDLSGNGYEGVLGAGAAAPTLGAVGIGDGWTAYSFDGGDNVNIYSAGLAADFDGTEGTVLISGKVANAGVWTDNAVRYLLELLVNGNDYIWLWKAANNQLNFAYRAGGTNLQIALATTPTSFFAAGITWSKAADQVRAYYAGVQTGSTQTGLGTWAGALSSTRCFIGAANALEAWSGSLAHFQLRNKALTPAQMAYLR